MVEARLHQLREPLPRKPNTGGDQVGIKTRLARASDQLPKIGTCQRLTSSEMKMQDSQCSRFAENPQPIRSRKLFVARGQLQRIRAVHAVQRAAVRDLGDERERI